MHTCSRGREQAWRTPKKKRGEESKTWISPTAWTRPFSWSDHSWNSAGASFTGDSWDHRWDVGSQPGPTLNATSCDRTTVRVEEEATDSLVETLAKRGVHVHQLDIETGGLHWWNFCMSCKGALPYSCHGYRDRPSVCWDCYEKMHGPSQYRPTRPSTGSSKIDAPPGLRQDGRPLTFQ